MTDPTDDKLIRHIRDALELGTTAMGRDTRMGLNQARRQALAQFEAFQDDDPLVVAARRQLDADLDTVNSRVSRRLDEIRHLALSAKPRTGWLQRRVEEFTGVMANYRLAVSASAFASLCVLITAATLLYRPPGSGSPSELEEEITLFASVDDIELYENLDFYLWLAENGLPN